MQVTALVFQLSKWRRGVMKQRILDSNKVITLLKLRNTSELKTLVNELNAHVSELKHTRVRVLLAGHECASLAYRNVMIQINNSKITTTSKRSCAFNSLMCVFNSLVCTLILPVCEFS